MNGPLSSPWLVALLPTFVTVGPLALLSLLFPALSGVLALASRRWLALFSVVSVVSTLYIFHAWFRGYLGGSALASPAAIWIVMAILSLVGTAWAARRRQARPGWSEVVSLVVFSLLSVVMTAYMLRPAAAPGVDVIWMFEPPERGAIVSSPIISGERIYLGIIHDTGLRSRGAVYCLERDTRRIVWTFDNASRMQPMYSSPCLAGGRIYIGEGMHGNYVCKFYCLDAQTGLKEWEVATTDHIESTPCVIDDRVFFAAGDDGIYCLDARNGRQLWHFRSDVHIDASPCVVGKLLYCGSGVSRLNKKTELLCLATENGKVIWEKPTRLPVWCAPVVSDGQLFVALGNGRLDKSAEPPEKPGGAILCVDGGTQEERWRFDLDDGVLASCCVDNSHVYFGARDGYAYALERRTGKFAWRSNLGSSIVTRLTLAGGRLYGVSSAGLVACLEADSGRALRKFDMGSYSKTSPRCYSSPCVQEFPQIEAGHRRIFIGTELRNPITSAAVLFQLKD
jgi:outer membrane protein assembly factor BamB